MKQQICRVTACAKLNLTLDIVGKRSDGYHNLRSVMQSVSLTDTVTLRTNGSGRITLECSAEGVPCDERNIAYKCAVSFYKTARIECTGLHISIEKNIPMQAGLAGGSADGAAVLRGLNELYGAPLSESSLIGLGASVGADIPFCLMGGTMLAQGIGEKLTRLPDIPPCSIVIVKPDVGISTAQAYSAADAVGFGGDQHTDRALESLNDLHALCACLHNGFEEALKIELIGSLTDKLKGFSGCLGSCMSGSGSAIFAVFESETNANACAQALKKEYPFAQTVIPTRAGTFAQIISAE